MLSGGHSTTFTNASPVADFWSNVHGVDMSCCKRRSARPTQRAAASHGAINTEWRVYTRPFVDYHPVAKRPVGTLAGRLLPTENCESGNKSAFSAAYAWRALSLAAR